MFIQNTHIDTKTIEFSFIRIEKKTHVENYTEQNLNRTRSARFFHRCVCESVWWRTQPVLRIGDIAHYPTNTQRKKHTHTHTLDVYSVYIVAIFPKTNTQYHPAQAVDGDYKSVIKHSHTHSSHTHADTTRTFTLAQINDKRIRFLILYVVTIAIEENRLSEQDSPIHTHRKMIKGCSNVKRCGVCDGRDLLN